MLATKGEMARYRYSTLSRSGLLSSGGGLRYCFSSSNMAYHSIVHWKFFVYLRALKNHRLFLTDLERNLLRATILPERCCISLNVLGRAISWSAWTFSGFALIPHCEDTIKSRNLPDMTLKVHLFRLSFIWKCQNIAKLSSRSAMWFSIAWIFTSMPSIYTSIFFLIYSLKILLMSFW